MVMCDGGDKRTSLEALDAQISWYSCFCLFFLPQHVLTKENSYLPRKAGDGWAVRMRECGGAQAKLTVLSATLGYFSLVVGLFPTLTLNTFHNNHCQHIHFFFRF